MQNIRKIGALLGAGAVIFSLAGCADRNGNGQPDSPATGAEVGDAAAKGMNAASDAGKVAANAATDAGKTVANVAADAGNVAADAGKKAADAVTGAGAAATLTPKVKAALGAQGALKGSSIDVDTNASTKTVILKGTVKSGPQKNLAGKVAKQNAGDFKVDNQLVVK
ncbi:hypothetical protein IAD21_01701 [Abditibacteriota bacterium]|nr:hypothetical protein IAD21_01701 [Abditibacteriota bacterium]